MKTQLETNYKFKEQEQNHNSCGFSSQKRMRMAFVYFLIGIFQNIFDKEFSKFKIDYKMDAISISLDEFESENKI